MVICLAGLSSTRLHGQAEATASRAGDLQIGTMFNLANSDYRPAYFKGFGFYSTYDFRYHVGIEGEFHQANDQNTTEGIYERTYEIGPRFVLHYGRFAPYTRVMYVFSPTRRPYSEILKSGPSQIWPTTYSLSTGVDYHVVPALNVTAEYEYQQWLSFPPNGLTPRIFSFGAAYRFH
jgi:opacity protein-like surface antigen